jgi:hypothetical protein
MTERNVRVLEDRARDDREAVLGRAALGAMPMPRLEPEFLDLLITAARAGDSLGPAVGRQMGFASILIRKSRFSLGDRHLVNATHGRFSFSLSPDRRSLTGTDFDAGVKL